MEAPKAQISCPPYIRPSFNFILQLNFSYPTSLCPTLAFIEVNSCSLPGTRAQSNPENPWNYIAASPKPNCREQPLALANSAVKRRASFCIPNRPSQLYSPANDSPMANTWPNPHQRDYVPFTLDDPIPAGQRQNPDTSAATRSCFCPICSGTTDTDRDMTGGTIIYQDPSPPAVHTIYLTASLSSFRPRFFSKGISRPRCKSECRWRPPSQHRFDCGLPSTSMVCRSTSSALSGECRICASA
ncbi:hypothetical protein V8E52_008800 [Russula decolorans]